ncbi:hypothetical protein B0H10DRAFT_158246, partial [Mycena sp. CBHHK59/15]
MENKDTPKARRPLPTPGSTNSSQQPPRPSTPAFADVPLASTSFVPPPSSPQKTTTLVRKNSSAVASSSISASNFYGPGSQPPALPSRPKNLGSTHTTIWQAPDELPSYSTSLTGSGYREPELVPELEDDIPDLVSTDADGGGWGGGSWSGNDWSREFTDNLVDIDGRDRHEEEHWWDPDVRQRKERPGRGILPPLLADNLHDPEHTLYSVSFTAPDIQPSPISQPPIAASSNPPLDPPSFEEVRASAPHPDAYYCPRDHGWIIISWGYSAFHPPLAASFIASPHPPLPKQVRRSSENCVESSANKTHHFHKYEKAVDAHKLAVPFRFDQWETIETVKQKRRVGTILPDELDLDKMCTEDDDKMDVDEQEGPLLDLYVCCQCKFYCLRSSVIPGVIPRPLWDSFIQDKQTNPQPGKSSERSVAMAMETLLMAIENKLWKGEARMLRVNRPGFQNKMGWNPIIKQVFDILGFTGDTFDTESGLRPPTTDVNVPQGKQNRTKLLRAWAE